MQQRTASLPEAFPASSPPQIIPRPVPTAAPVAQPHVVRGREPILALQPLLAEFASSCEQAGEADSLPHFLSTPDALKKRPCLVLIARGTASPVDSSGTPILSELAGAVLLFEYLGLPRKSALATRVYTTTDGTGRRNVFAPPGQRARIAGLAAHALIQAGACIIQINFSESHSDRTQHPDPNSLAASHDTPTDREEQAILKALREGPSPLPRSHWNLHHRVVQLYLPLLDTYDQTLARIGQKTRANLRYYRRKAEAELGAAYVPEVHIDRASFLAFNQECFHKVSQQVASARFDHLGDTPTAYLRGLRDQNGRWLALVRGRRQHGFVEIDWQMNSTQYPAYSLATSVRSFLIEHEVTLGSTRLYVEGTTAMAIGRSFLWGPASELTLKRDTPYVRLLEHAARKLPGHYLAQTLCNPQLRWERTGFA